MAKATVASLSPLAEALWLSKSLDVLHLRAMSLPMTESQAPRPESIVIHQPEHLVKSTVRTPYQAAVERE